MRKALLSGGLVCLVFGLVGADAAHAQEQQEDEGPGMRYVTVTSFEVPFNDRPQVFQHILTRVLPATKLNPNVVNSRVLLHNWGSNASQVVMVAEYESWDAIEAECGQPCDDFYESNPVPEEGEEGYEAYRERLELFNEYYAKHRDEIYTSPMGGAKVEGELMGPVVPPAPQQ